MNLEPSWQIFKKYAKMKSHEYPSSGCGVFPCWRTGGWTDITKIIVAFRYFRAPLKMSIIWKLKHITVLSIHLWWWQMVPMVRYCDFLDTKHRNPNQKSLDSSFHVLWIFHNHFKNDVHLQFERKFISFLTKDTVRFYTNGESVNDIYLNNISL
jgi:hypothetical protein